MDIKDRISRFAMHKGLTIKAFEQKCGLSNGYVAAMRKGFGPEKLNNVLCAFPDLNREWLVYGEGDMLKSSSSITIGNVMNNSNTIVGAQSTINVSSPAVREQSPSLDVPVIPMEMYEKENLDVYEVVHSDTSIRKSPIVHQFADYDTYYIVYGEDMAPYFLAGDKVAIKPYKQGEERIFGGKTYVVDTYSNGMLLRMLYLTEDGYIAKAHNARYADVHIPRSDVIRVFRVLGLIRISN